MGCKVTNNSHNESKSVMVLTKTKGNEMRNIVIKQKRDDFMASNSMVYYAVDADTSEILGQAYWGKDYGSWHLRIDGKELEMEEVCDARFGHRKDAFQKDAPCNKKHPDFIGMTNPAYTTRHYYTEWNNFHPTVKSVKTILTEMTQDIQTPSKYFWKD